MGDEELVRAIRRERGTSLHEFVTPACVHRDHGHCEYECEFCGGVCLCVCHRWPVPVGGEPVEKG